MQVSLHFHSLWNLPLDFSDWLKLVPQPHLLILTQVEWPVDLKAALMLLLGGWWVTLPAGASSVGRNIGTGKGETLPPPFQLLLLSGCKTVEWCSGRGLVGLGGLFGGLLEGQGWLMNREKPSLGCKKAGVWLLEQAGLWKGPFVETYS